MWPEDAAKLTGCSDDLKSLLRSCNRFLIYNTQVYQEFYVRLIPVVASASQQVQSKGDSSQVNPSYQMSQRLSQGWRYHLSEASAIQGSLRFHLNLPLQIITIDDLELALIEIVKGLVIGGLQKRVMVSSLSKQFYVYYKQPIRTALRDVCPDMKLIELLGTIPGWSIQQEGHEWCIFLEELTLP